MHDFESAAIIAEQAQSEIDRLQSAYDRMVALLREAQDMWAFSGANATRGHYDCEWNKKREELLKDFGEPTHAPWNQPLDQG